MYCSLETYRGLAAGFDVIGQIYANYKTGQDPYLDPVVGIIDREGICVMSGR